MRSKFTVWQTGKFTVSATSLVVPSVLPTKGRNPLGAVSCIESVEPPSHEVKR